MQQLSCAHCHGRVCAGCPLAVVHSLRRIRFVRRRARWCTTRTCWAWNSSCAEPTSARLHTSKRRCLRCLLLQHVAAHISMRRQLALFGDCMQIKEAPEPDDFCAQLARARTHAPHVHEELHTRMRAQEKIPRARLWGAGIDTLSSFTRTLSPGQFARFCHDARTGGEATVAPSKCVWEAGRLY